MTYAGPVPALYFTKNTQLYVLTLLIWYKHTNEYHSSLLPSVMIRHERNQSFLVPVPVRKKFRPGPGSGEKKILVPAGKSFRSRSRSLQTQIVVPFSVKDILVTVLIQKKHFGPGPVQKKFWCWS